jgi:ubiquitin carboxyl-terminal hydrolase 5/13
MHGPGFTGMRNLGNSCYMNSAMQLLFSLPEFEQKYVNTRDQHLQLTPVDPSGEFNLQMAKLGHGLLSGEYSAPVDESQEAHLRVPRGIKPASFKSLIGRGHPEFSTKRQQDAHEFLTYLFSLIERNQRTDLTSGSQLNPLDSFKFKLTDRFECSQSHQVNFYKKIISVQEYFSFRKKQVKIILKIYEYK